MTLDVQALLREAEEGVFAYATLGKLVAAETEAITRELGYECTVTSRPKSPSHIVLKVLKKYADDPDPLGRVGDRGGVRVVAPHLAAAKEISDAIEQHLEVLDVEDIRDRYRPNELGYLAIHLQVRPKTFATDHQGLRKLTCEVQIHTLAQNAWSVAEHALVYKPVGEVPPDLESAVYRAVALVSLFDDEIDRVRAEVLSDPRHRPASMLDTLIKRSLRWRPNGYEPDLELSLEVLSILIEDDVYRPDELEEFDELIDNFLDANRALIDSTMADQEGHADVELLPQPEAIAIYERLKSRPEKVRGTWQRSPLPNHLLTQLSNAFGLGE